MKEIIKKILREYDELNWIDDASANVRVTSANVFEGAKVKLAEDSIYKHQPDYQGYEQLSNYTGVVIINSIDKSLFYYEGNINTWVLVGWIDDSGASHHRYYRVGPNHFDLVFA